MTYTEDITVIDTIPAYSIEDGDQIVVDGDHMEVRSVRDGEDIDEVIVKGYSHLSGDTVEYSLMFTDMVDVWAL